MIFSAPKYKPKGHGFGIRIGYRMKWVANQILWVPRRTGVAVIQGVLEGHS
jgi:hypothetical protein